MKKNWFEMYAAIIFAIVLPCLAIMIIVTTIMFCKDVFASEKVTYEDYVVQVNDTLWSIATENKKDKQDIREYVHQLRQLNNIDDCIIVPGQTIQIIK